MRAAGVFIAACVLIAVGALPPVAGLKARTTTVVVQPPSQGFAEPRRSSSDQSASGGGAFRPAASVAQDLSPARQPTLRIGVARPGGYTVRAIPVDEYVAGVLAGEAARESAPSALEALAITVRTFAVANLSRHRADGFDLCDETHCQVLRAATLATERAAAATTGRVLLYQGAPASVFYSASCGGRTERPSEVWPGARNPEFLPSREDDACGGTPAWTAALSSLDLIRALRASGFTGSALRDVRILGRNTSGRVTGLRLEGFSPDHISGQDLRVVIGRTLGWQHIKSTAFDLRRIGTVYQFSGHGSGHGVGLCVIGSARLGARGQTPPQILARYFPGAAIALMPASVVAALEPAGAPRAAGPEAPQADARPRAPIAAAPRAASATVPAAADSDVIIALPEGDEGERDVLLDVAIQARRALARTLGVADPPRVTLRLHPTVESYQRATGQPWYTAGATLDTEIHLVPLTVLRERGVLERTIRHEIVHLLTHTELATRPLWVQEGTAIHFAGEGAGAGESARPADPGGKISCPGDRELRQPASPGALSNAYARAAACVGRQIGAGKKWSEIR